MGQPMCLNLLKAGFKVIVYNRTASKMDNTIKAGAIPAESPKAVAKESDVIITMVTDSPDVMEVVLGENGVIQGIREDSVLIDMSTISPKVTQEIAAELQNKNAHMLDAPVSGGDTGAINGTLAIMVGGNKKIFQRCLPILNIIGKTVTYVGNQGTGQIVKLCNQILVSVTNMAVCEAILFAQKAGVDPEVMIRATSQGAGGSWQLSNLGPKMIKQDFSPGFSVELQLKDLRLALESAGKMEQPLPALTLVNELFLLNKDHREEKEGTQALIKSIARLSK
ncbi:NAD(P)-dependent oxidoreductase [bacterium]|nr:NAD(P)-dependent oxidoreductase [bacterium]RQV97990.1 MAG: NAD(P)-dependent oxidoreductase [bacterium]